MPIKWVIDEQRNGDRAIRCSSCGAVVEDEEWANHNYYYCYHCGGEAENPQEPLVIGRKG